MADRVRYMFFDTPIGRLLAAASAKGLCKLCLPGEPRDRFVGWVLKNFDGTAPEEGCHPLLEEAAEQVIQYLDGKRSSFSVNLDLRGTVFQRRVWHVLLQIPYGSTWSYKQVAQALDNPGAVRAVGQANNRNPMPIIVPCHRVVGSGGDLIGYGGGLDIKKRLLELEGIKTGKAR